jgi:Tol biopolymer transport system component
LLISSCGDEEESGTWHFDNCDIRPLHSESGSDPAWAPDGSSIIFSDKYDLWSISPSGGQPTQLTSMEGSEFSPNWNADASSPKLIFINSTSTGEYIIYTMTPGGEPQEVQTFTQQISSPQWSKDGTKIVFLQPGKKGIYVIPAEGGEVSQIPSSSDWGTVQVAVTSPARDIVLYVDKMDLKARINSISIDGGESTNIVTFTDGVSEPFAMAESYDGSLIAYATPYERSFVKNLLMVSSAGGNPIKITGFYDNTINHPSWSPDGDKLVIQLMGGIHLLELKL